MRRRTKDTPAEIIDRSTKESMRPRRCHVQVTPRNLGAAIRKLARELGRFIVDYTEKWSKVIRATGISADKAVPLSLTFHNVPYACADRIYDQLATQTPHGSFWSRSGIRESESL